MGSLKVAPRDNEAAIVLDYDYGREGREKFARRRRGVA